MNQIQFIFDYTIHGSFEKFLSLNPHLPIGSFVVIEWINTSIGTDTTRSRVSKAVIYYPYKINISDVPTY